MSRIRCLSCLRLWFADRVENRASCPFCGGALEESPVAISGAGRSGWPPGYLRHPRTAAAVAATTSASVV